MTVGSSRGELARERVGPVSIAFIARGGEMDGAARQLSYLLAHLDRTRFAPVVCLDRNGPLATHLRGIGIATHVARMRPWRSVRGWPFRHFDLAAIVRGCRARGVRLVHCSDPWRGPYAARVSRALAVPLVMHVRGPTTRRDLAKNACLEADAIIGIAARYRDEIEAAGYDAASIAICNDAVDGNVYAPDDVGGAAFRSSVSGDASTPIVGLVGRVEPFKRVREFVEVVAALPRDWPARFVIVGDLGRRRYVSDVRALIAKRGLGDRVVLLGRRVDMRAVLGGLDALVTLSGGSVMFEAMACGVPVLSIRGDGRHSQHTLHDATAWCATTDDPRVAATSLSTLLNDPTRRRRLAATGRAYVLDRLSPSTMARETEAVYERVLAARSSAASRGSLARAIAD